MYRGKQALDNRECGVVHDAFVLDRYTVGISDHCPVRVVPRLGDHYHPGWIAAPPRVNRGTTRMNCGTTPGSE